MNIIHAQTPDQIDVIRELFREYESFLGVDLCFQSFEEELETLPGKYAPPTGALLLAMVADHAAGCVAVRGLDSRVCEMKRLFVRPQHRGNGLGYALTKAIIREAIKLGYTVMRLDTLDRLKEAMRLYSSQGFIQIGPYYENPLPGVVYWELNLMGWQDS
jgi:GNAT superfamily N-acetyltransferase